MSTPTIDRFLTELASILRTKNGVRLQDFLLLEPPLPPLYDVIIQELKRSYPAGRHAPLESKCKSMLPEDQEGDVGGSWTAFISFLVQYFAFIRDVDVQQLVKTHDMLKSLLNQCILALSDASMGIVVLPTVIAYSRVLARLAIGLDKHPELIANLTQRRTSSVAGDSDERITLVENSANVIREAFKKCLSERSGNIATGLDVEGRPGGRRIGIYLCANICLKLFFHCRKLRSAEQIFSNIYQQSPPLSRFPASQRVTFLYYLGRYHFANNHFYRSQLALQAAYNQCHKQCLRQKRSILIHLIAANIILGRFPSSILLSRPEASGLDEVFSPICRAIQMGDMTSFAHLTDLRHANAAWLLKKRVLFPIRNRCEVLIWRSLARRVFLLSNYKRDGSRAAPSVDIKEIHTLVTYLEMQIRRSNARGNGLPAPIEEDLSYGEIDPDLEDEVDLESDLPKLEEVEAAVASLVRQELLKGYVSHKHCRFVIPGARERPPIEVGFPQVWDVIQSTADKEVPGWVQDSNRAGHARQTAGGMVVNLSGARPVGAVPG